MITARSGGVLYGWAVTTTDGARALADFWAVVPAGGAGTRLWPLSRAASPKFLLDLTGSGRSLLQETVTRVTGLAADRVLVVTGAEQRDRVAAQLDLLPDGSVIAEL